MFTPCLFHADIPGDCIRENRQLVHCKSVLKQQMAVAGHFLLRGECKNEF